MKRKELIKTIKNGINLYKDYTKLNDKEIGYITALKHILFLLKQKK